MGLAWTKCYETHQNLFIPATVNTHSNMDSLNFEFDRVRTDLSKYIECVAQAEEDQILFKRGIIIANVVLLGIGIFGLLFICALSTLLDNRPDRNVYRPDRNVYRPDHNVSSEPKPGPSKQVKLDPTPSTADIMAIMAAAMTTRTSGGTYDHLQPQAQSPLAATNQQRLSDSKNDPPPQSPPAKNSLEDY